METRKIQRVSNGTYTVSLPREWATGQGLSAGDVVELHSHLDGTLVVQPTEGEAARVDLRVTDETPAELARLLRAAYATGALEIHVAAEEFGDDRRAALRSVVRSLSGVTIADESESAVVVRNVLDSEQVSIRQSVRHLQFVALSRHREATAALCDPDASPDVSTEDDRADRLSAVVERYFVRSLSRLDEVDRLGERRRDLFCFYRLADELARIASCADRIAALAAASDDVSAASAAARAELEAAAERAREAVETAVEAVFEPDPSAIQEVFDTREEVCASLEDLDRRLFDAPTGDARLARSLSAVRRTAEGAASIASVGLHCAVREGAFAERRRRPGDVDAAGDADNADGDDSGAETPSAASESAAPQTDG